MTDKCKVCGNTRGNQKYVVRERIINKGDMFAYIKCAKCGTLFLQDDIKDMSEWYPDDYNPYNKNRERESVWVKIKRKILTEIIIRLHKETHFQKLVENENIDVLLSRLFGTQIKKNAAILDIGCASGYWLDWMCEMGWHDVTGVDLFCSTPNKFKIKWNFVQGDIFSLNGEKKYDCIVFNHSFEHMDYPQKVLDKVNCLLSENGIAIISIPLIDGIGWKQFGVDFCMIDAPRHKYILTSKAMKYLCKKSGLVVTRILYDANNYIPFLSEKYKNTNKSNKEIAKIPYSISKQNLYKKMIKESNIKHNADQAIFYVKKQRKDTTGI